MGKHLRLLVTYHFQSVYGVCLQVYCRKITVCVRKRPLNKKGTAVVCVHTLLNKDKNHLLMSQHGVRHVSM